MRYSLGLRQTDRGDRMTGIPLEPFIIFGMLGIGAWLDKRDADRAARIQLALDRVHHGTELKPYDWELEEN
jgi:hypothetical protein